MLETFSFLILATNDRENLKLKQSVPHALFSHNFENYALRGGTQHRAMSSCHCLDQCQVMIIIIYPHMEIQPSRLQPDVEPLNQESMVGSDPFSWYLVFFFFNYYSYNVFEYKIYASYFAIMLF